MARDEIIATEARAATVPRWAALWEAARKRGVALVVLGAIAGYLAATLLLALVPPQALVDQMSDSAAPTDVVFDPLDYAYGLYPSEKLPDGATYRWTGPQATLTFPYAANLGRYMHLSVRLASAWAQGQPPAKGTLLVNGKPLVDFTAQREFQVVEATIDAQQTPNPYLEPAHIQVDIKSATSRVPGDARDLGVAIDWITVTPERGRAEIALEAVVWAVCLGLVVFVAMARMGGAWALVFGAGALFSFGVIRLTYIPRGIPPFVEVALAALAWALAAMFAPKKRAVWGLALAAGLVWLVVAGRLLGDWQMDDAYISYRYAWNLVHGHGLVYNMGEVVEGYTNFLWTLVAAAAIAVGLHPAGVMLALNIGLAMGVMALAWRLAAKLSGGVYIGSLMAVVLLSIDGALVAYGARGSGMEAMAFAFFVLLATSLLWAEQGKWTHWWRAAGGIALALGALTRPEGLLVAIVLVSVRAWQDWQQGLRNADRGIVQRGGAEARSSIAVPHSAFRIPYSAFRIPYSVFRIPERRLLGAVLVPFLAIVVPYQLWRIAFYGYPFPNTFYAKTGTSAALISRGLEYTGVFLGERWFVAALAGAGIILALLKWKRGGVGVALSALTLVYAVYILWVGGDYFPGWRFFVPVLAPMVLLAVMGARTLYLHLPQLMVARVAAVAVLVAVGGLYANSALWLQEKESVLAELTKLHTTYVNLWGSAGLWLRDNTPPQSWTAAKGAGAIAYYSQRPVLDMYGLNDLHIGHLQVDSIGQGKAGHEKQDPAYVLNKKPDYIFGQWANYFEPIADQLAREYATESERSPTGPVLEWLRRR